MAAISVARIERLVGFSGIEFEGYALRKGFEAEDSPEQMKANVRYPAAVQDRPEMSFCRPLDGALSFAEIPAAHEH